MKFIIWGGMVMFIGSILLILSNWKDLEIDQKGVIVNMRIEKMPGGCIGTKVQHFAKLSYEGEVFTKAVGGTFCDDHVEGELIPMRHLKGHTKVLFPNETASSNLIACVLLGLMGLGITLYQWRKGK